MFYFIPNTANGSVSLTLTEMVNAGKPVLDYLASVCDGQNIQSISPKNGTFAVYKPRSLCECIEVLTALGGVQNVMGDIGFIPRGAITPRWWDSRSPKKHTKAQRR